MEEINKISLGCEVFDRLLGGGVEKGVISCVYGPAGVGKTSFCLLLAKSVLQSGRTVVFIDTEGGFSLERMRQIYREFDSVSKNFILINLSSFNEQSGVLKDVTKIVSRKEVGLIVFDSIVHLYRLLLSENSSKVNSELANQLSFLSRVARQRNIPVVVTSQMYLDFETQKERIVSGDVLRYGCKCIIRMESVGGGSRRAILEKHRSIKSGGEVNFEICEEGFREVSTKDTQKSKRIFGNVKKPGGVFNTSETQGTSSRIRKTDVERGFGLF